LYVLHCLLVIKFYTTSFAGHLQGVVLQGGLLAGGHRHQTESHHVGVDGQAGLGDEEKGFPPGQLQLWNPRG
jgi:hypothetical protein